LKTKEIDRSPFSAAPSSVKRTERERTLDNTELAEIWAAVEGIAAPFGNILRLLTLTGQRREEVAQMTWDEISDDIETWALPAHRAKNDEAQIVPLAPQVRTILRALLPTDEEEAERELAARKMQGNLVFPGRRKTPFSGFSKAKAELDAAIAEA